jgi:hypothetical protein
MTGPLAVASTDESKGTQRIYLAFLRYDESIGALVAEEDASLMTHVIVKLPAGDYGIQEYYPDITGQASLMNMGGTVIPLLIPNEVGDLVATPSVISITAKEGERPEFTFLMTTLGGFHVSNFNISTEFSWLSLKSIDGDLITMELAENFSIGVYENSVYISGQGALETNVQITLTVVVPSLESAVFSRSSEAMFTESVVSQPTFARSSLATFIIQTET